MYKAIRGALTLAMTILVIKIFLPEIAESLISLITKILDFSLELLNQISSSAV